MDAGSRRNLALANVAAGVAIIVLAVLLFGLTTASGAIDVVSVVTASAGVVLLVTGLYTLYRNRGTGSPQAGPRPHTASR